MRGGCGHERGGCGEHQGGCGEDRGGCRENWGGYGEDRGGCEEDWEGCGEDWGRCGEDWGGCGEDRGGCGEDRGGCGEDRGGCRACPCAFACVSPIADGGGLPAPPVSPLTVHTDLCTHALLVHLVLVHPLLLCYLFGPAAALSALFTWSFDFLPFPCGALLHSPCTFVSSHCPLGAAFWLPHLCSWAGIRRGAAQRDHRPGPHVCSYAGAIGHRCVCASQDGRPDSYRVLR